MNNHPIQFLHFQENKNFPLLEVALISQDRDIRDYLLRIAVELYEDAADYQGIPYEKDPNKEIRIRFHGNTIAQFAILFPTQYKLNCFLDEETRCGMPWKKEQL